MKKINKILVVGYFSKDPKIYTYATSFYNTFLKLGYNTQKFDYRNKYFFNNKINSYLINIFLQKKVSKFKPDLIFFIKAETVFSKTIKNIKNFSKSYLVNFYPDNPFVFWNGNSNKNILESLIYYDCFLIWSKKLIPILYSAGCKKVQYFPFAYDKNLFPEEIEITQQDKNKYQSDICFVGTWDKQREKFLTELCNKIPSLDLAIWGNMWQENLPKNSILKNKIRDKAIYNTDMIKAFRLSKIVLNFIRKQNYDAHNMRTFEISASKAFLLTQRTKEQASFLFKEGETIECFSSVDELIEKINFYLENSAIRDKIIQNSFLHVQKFNLQFVLENFIQEFVGRVNVDKQKI